MKRFGFALVGLVLILGATPASGLLAATAQRPIRTYMLNTGVTPAARGRITYAPGTRQSVLTLAVRKLAPSTSYDVVVNGRVVDHVKTNAAGGGKIVRRSRAAGRTGGLAYDPRGASVELDGPDGPELEADVPGCEEEGDSLDEIRLDLTAAAGVTGAASAEFRERAGRMKFEVRVEGTIPGTYDLLVAGAAAGQIVVGVDGSGELEFDSVPSTGEELDDDSSDQMDLLLTFDPRGQTIEIQQAGATSFSGTLPTAPPAPVVCPDDDQGDDDGGGGDD
ncbi:MAG TPA: hypothetical protein VE404_01860 [Verrucomicrobiae bacterium]|nr:hypothetical protein [Verrucomicrobiae bacterium]